MRVCVLDSHSMNLHKVNSKYLQEKSIEVAGGVESVLYSSACPIRLSV